MAVTEFFAGIAVADYASLLAWYERLMGKPPDFFPQDGEAVWQVSEHAWIYVVADTERAGRSLLTILVEDLDDQVAQLAERGLEPTKQETYAEGMRKITYRDPEGNEIAFGGASR
jgi:hypothetical protein